MNASISSTPSWWLSALMLVAVLFGPSGAMAKVALAPAEPPTAPAARPGTGTDTPDPAQATRDTLHFFNGDTLHGGLRAIDPRTGIQWQHPDAKQVLDLQPTNIRSITLGGVPAGADRPSHAHLVRMTNQDTLLGDVTALDAENLVLQTWYAGKVTIPRKLLESILTVQGTSGAVYRGPTGLEGWTMASPQGTWHFHKGAFEAAQAGATLGRDLKLPDVVAIDFELTWRGYLQFAISLFADQFEGYGGNCYMLSLNNSYVQLARMRANQGSDQLGNAEVSSLQQRTKARFGIRINKPERLIALMVDGMLVKQWRDPGQFGGRGTGLVFLQQAQGLIRLSDIQVTAWDGKFAEEAPAAKATTEDVLQLTNNDKVSGALQTIHGGKVTFATSYAKLELPLERIRSMDFIRAKSTPPPPGNAEIRAEFADRGSLTFTLESWTDQQLTASSPSFGRLRFAPSAFRVLRFNLARQGAEVSSGDFFIGTDEVEDDDRLSRPVPMPQ